jgi:hypothetical protein
MWPVEAYINGTDHDESRIVQGGYVQWRVDGLWHPAHRLVIARREGRHLERHEVVIHLDNNRQNNDPANLELMSKSRAIKWRKEHPLVTDEPKEFVLTVRFVGRMKSNEDDLPNAEDVRQHVRGMVGDMLVGQDDDEPYYIDRFEVKRVYLEDRDTDDED